MKTVSAKQGVSVNALRGNVHQSRVSRHVRRSSALIKQKHGYRTKESGLCL